MEKFNSQTQLHGASSFMLGALLNLMAVIDMTGLLDYAIKAFIGGLIWLGFKFLGDYVSRKMNPNQEGEKPPEDKFKPKP
jgi:hypothetical protein